MINTTKTIGRLRALVVAALLLTGAHLLAQQPRESMRRVALLTPAPAPVLPAAAPDVERASFEEARLVVPALAAPALSVPSLPLRNSTDFWGRDVVISAPSTKIVVEPPDMEDLSMFEEARLAVPALAPPVVLAASETQP